LNILLRFDTVSGFRFEKRRKELIEKVDERVRKRWGDGGVGDVYILRSSVTPPRMSLYTCQRGAG
jgi:hypothetical protein